jgi:hypothetical protein
MPHLFGAMPDQKGATLHLFAAMSHLKGAMTLLLGALPNLLGAAANVFGGMFQVKFYKGRQTHLMTGGVCILLKFFTLLLQKKLFKL